MLHWYKLLLEVLPCWQKKKKEGSLLLPAHEPQQTEPLLSSSNWVYFLDNPVGLFGDVAKLSGATDLSLRNPSPCGCFIETKFEGFSSRLCFLSWEKLLQNRIIDSHSYKVIAKVFGTPLFKVYSDSEIRLGYQNWLAVNGVAESLSCQRLIEPHNQK
jgi:hypothetical protein